MVINRQDMATSTSACILNIQYSKYMNEYKVNAPASLIYGGDRVSTRSGVAAYPWYVL